MTDDNVSVHGLTLKDLSEIGKLCDVMNEYPEAGMASIYGDVLANLCDLQKGEESSHYFGIFINNKLIGMCSLGGPEPYYDEGSILSDVIILPEYQMKGYGTALVTAVINRAEEFPIYADCLDNQQHFYGRIGFVQNTENDCEMILEEKEKER